MSNELLDKEETAKSVSPRWISNRYIVASIALALGLAVHLSMLGKWPLDGDEVYTLRDASTPPLDIMFKNEWSSHKPIYYLIAHYSRMLPYPDEFTLRLPAAIAGALTPCVYCLMLWRPGKEHWAIYTTLLVGTNPWVFELSQFARFYTLMFLFASIATLALVRWIDDRRHRWLVLALVSGALATLTHTTALAMFGAAILAIAIVSLREHGSEVFQFIYRRWLTLSIGFVAFSISTGYVVSDIFVRWLNSQPGQFGKFSRAQLLIAVLLFGGFHVWALAMGSCLKRPRQWTTIQWFSLIMIFANLFALILIAPIGGGVASRYLLSALPCLFVLAGQACATFIPKIGDVGARLGVVGALLSFNVPYIFSTLADGNHYDYRTAASFVKALELNDPILAATSHGNYMLYAGETPVVVELGDLIDMNGGRTGDGSFAGKVLVGLMQEAKESSRPLVLISREDRHALDAKASRWMGERFVVLAVIEKPRYDHRRNKLVIYQYRPAA